MTASPTPIAIGVFPADELDRRPLLFAALEGVFPVRFEGRQPGELREIDAALEIGGVGIAGATAIPLLSLLVAEPVTGGKQVVQNLATAPELDRRLRGAALPDSHLGAAQQAASALAADAGALVLASCAGEPTWIRSGRSEQALLGPAELGPEEALRERLCLSRSAALLPLVHFLRQLSAPIDWQPPATRACILFDDPNLHWPSYGFIKLKELSEHTRAHGYHASLAMVPLDSWFAHPAAVRTLKQSDGTISLTVHGNNHNGGELGRQETEADGLALAAQALRRIAAFERRTGIAVDRTMVPPHEECSQATVEGLSRCGFEAITMTRPLPWLARPPRSWLARLPGTDALIGWRPADFAGALPVLLRHPLLSRDPPELVLRAFLDQPLILYGHHNDLAEGGLDVLASAVNEVNRLGGTRWCSLSEIVASNFETRLQGSQLSVRPLTRRARVVVPDTVEQLLVELPAAHPGPANERLIVDGRPAEHGDPVEVVPGSTVELRLQAHNLVDVATVPAPRRQPGALARRALGEGRDRLLPLFSRAR
ncbi:MAG TPA: hypothetical protein VNS60_12355 [Solirubrobacterales bacterium]|nr:hypothetical protein [Solirubrobacterales bacterium]